MGRAKLIKSIVNKTGVDKRSCTQVFDAMPDAIMEELIDNGEASIIGLAKFEVVDKAPRRARDPKTGNVINYPATKGVRCRISKNFKDAVIKGNTYDE